LAARHTAAYRGTQLVSSWNGTSASTTIVRVAADPPRVRRLDYEPVGGGRRVVVVEQEGDQIRFEPGRRDGQRLRLSDLIEDEELTKSSQLAWLQENYTLRASARRTLGRAVTRVEVVPRQKDRPSRRLDIDVATGVVLRSERIGLDGRLKTLSAFLDFDPRPTGWLQRVAVPARLVDTAVPRRARSEEIRGAFSRRPIAIVAPGGSIRRGNFSSTTLHARCTRSSRTDYGRSSSFSSLARFPRHPPAACSGRLTANPCGSARPASARSRTGRAMDGC
jgi:hypothetical protein